LLTTECHSMSTTNSPNSLLALHTCTTGHSTTWRHAIILCDDIISNVTCNCSRWTRHFWQIGYCIPIFARLPHICSCACQTVIYNMLMVNKTTQFHVKVNNCLVHVRHRWCTETHPYFHTFRPARYVMCIKNRNNTKKNTIRWSWCICIQKLARRNRIKQIIKYSPNVAMNVIQHMTMIILQYFLTITEFVICEIDQEQMQYYSKYFLSARISVLRQMNIYID
jgi:hypothetical protein